MNSKELIKLISDINNHSPWPYRQTKKYLSSEFCVNNPQQKKIYSKYQTNIETENTIKETQMFMTNSQNGLVKVLTIPIRMYLLLYFADNAMYVNTCALCMSDHILFPFYDNKVITIN